MCNLPLRPENDGGANSWRVFLPPRGGGSARGRRRSKQSASLLCIYRSITARRLSSPWRGEGDASAAWRGLARSDRARDDRAKSLDASGGGGGSRSHRDTPT